MINNLALLSGIGIVLYIAVRAAVLDRLEQRAKLLRRMHQR